MSRSLQRISRRDAAIDRSRAALGIWASVICGSLVIMCAFSAIDNLFAPADSCAYHRSCGPWFHLVLGGLEFAAAGLVACRRSRLWGALLCSMLLVVTAGLLLFHAQSAGVVELILMCLALVVTITVGREEPRHPGMSPAGD